MRRPPQGHGLNQPAAGRAGRRKNERWSSSVRVSRASGYCLIGMLFCPGCANMLVISDESTGFNKWVCQTCPYEFPITKQVRKGTLWRSGCSLVESRSRSDPRSVGPDEFSHALEEEGSR